jgi:hypothetical protein
VFVCINKFPVSYLFAEVWQTLPYCKRCPSVALVSPKRKEYTFTDYTKQKLIGQDKRTKWRVEIFSVVAYSVKKIFSVVSLRR